MDEAAAQPHDPTATADPQLREVSEEELKHILAQHEMWLETKGREGELIDLSGANLKAADLVGANLQRANLREANLEGAGLQSANLFLAELVAANLSGADLRGADLRDANLEKANLQTANLQEANFVGAHLAGATLFKASLEGSNFFTAYLSNANLQEANLQQANLQEVKLQGAVLVDANLQQANLYDAFLVNADLRRAHFGQAILEEANLQGANLANAYIDDASGLRSLQLAGADLTGAVLPEEIAKFEGVKQVEKICQIARPIYVLMILFCLYAFASIASTTDLALVTNSPAQVLPNLSTALPTAGFYYVAPLFLFLLYVYLSLYLMRLWSNLAKLPAIFPDGEPIYEHVYPWLVTSLTEMHVSLFKFQLEAFSGVRFFFTVFLVWWLCPLTLFLFWLRYLPVHDWLGTSLQLAALVFATAFGTASYRLATETLRGYSRTHRNYWSIPIIACIAVLGSLLSVGAIESAPADRGVRSWIPGLFSLVGFRTSVDLRDTNISTKPSSWTGAADRPKEELRDVGLMRKAQAELAEVKGASLQGHDLRHALMTDAFLVKADLRDADLSETDLEGAHLQGALLEHANLREATLDRADLRGADFSYASLQNAYLRKANLQDADLSSADLKEAKLIRANLQGAILRTAILKGTNLIFADLSGANLRGAKGLTQDQLDQACGNEATQLPEGLTISPCE